MMNSYEHDDSRAKGETQGQQTLKGVLERVTWSSPDSAFIVARLRVDGELFPVTVVGEMMSPSVGDDFILTGTWEEHQKYGRQFHFTSYELEYPTTGEGIIRYLSSGLIRGIGKALAARIVDHFGSETMEVMNTRIERLLEIDGIGEKKLSAIRKAWDAQRGVQHVMLFLKAHGISTAFAVRIYRVFGANAVHVIRDDPYRLAQEVEGIGFTTADSIARGMGILADDPRRLLAGASYVLGEAARRDGHCCLPVDEFIHHAANLMGTDADSFASALREATARGLVIEEGDMVYVPELFHAERAIASALRRAHNEIWNGLDHLALDDALKRIEQRHEISYNAQQVEAIHKCIAGPVCILTGGPGTGKTTTLLGLLQLATELDMRCAVCAPTGRAAKRITEMTGIEARTIHRLLEFDPMVLGFQRNQDNPIEADLLVVDEMSMVDCTLFAALLAARPPGCRIVLVGDADQLPSVGPGTVLRDLIACAEIDTVVLKLIFRQKTHSSIVTNAHRVRDGFMPVFDKRRIDGGETFFREVEQGENIAHLIRDLVAERIPRELDCDPMRDIQVLSPMYNTTAGVTNLNHVLQQALNAGARVLMQRGDRVFRAGDKVMQTRNDYEKDVYNGDIGYVRSYDEDEQTLRVLFDGRAVEYAPEDTDALVLAYAITIHKSQGSEYRVVLLPVVTQHRIMLRRTLLYTAMTRAKHMLVLLGQRSAVSMAVNTAREHLRYSGLLEQLRLALR
ncbi:MAG: ATP-dependent RecD-like DNA helicase [Bacteroidia bacterium]|nr:ATP-dependent RecD-like DNA helicase [Bacteroidia bacterium]